MKVIINIMINDQFPGGLEGYAAVGEVMPSEWSGIVEDRGNVFNDTPYAFVADLIDGDELVGSKGITDAQVSGLLGQSIPLLLSVGRQRLAQLTDDASEGVRVDGLGISTRQETSHAG